LVAPIRWLD